MQGILKKIFEKSKKIHPIGLRGLLAFVYFFSFIGCCGAASELVLTGDSIFWDLERGHLLCEHAVRLDREGLLLDCERLEAWVSGPGAVEGKKLLKLEASENLRLQLKQHQARAQILLYDADAASLCLRGAVVLEDFLGYKASGDALVVDLKNRSVTLSGTPSIHFFNIELPQLSL